MATLLAIDGKRVFFILLANARRLKYELGMSDIIRRTYLLGMIRAYFEGLG